MIKKNCAYIQEPFVTQIYLIEYVSTNKVSGFNCTFIVNEYNAELLKESRGCSSS